jgi:hypothetical protein
MCPQYAMSASIAKGLERIQRYIGITNYYAKAD